MKEETGGQQQVAKLSFPPGANGKRLTNLPAGAAQNQLPWSHDESKILIWIQSPPSIWLANVRSSEVKQIATPSGTMSLNFLWFRPGKDLLAARQRRRRIGRISKIPGSVTEPTKFR
jgi:hypothetical protein